MCAKPGIHIRKSKKNGKSWFILSYILESRALLFQRLLRFFNEIKIDFCLKRILRGSLLRTFNFQYFSFKLPSELSFDWKSCDIKTEAKVFNFSNAKISRLISTWSKKRGARLGVNTRWGILQYGFCDLVWKFLIFFSSKNKYWLFISD